MSLKQIRDVIAKINPAPYVLTATMSLVIVTLVMQLWKADFSRPFHYNWDSIYEGAVIQTITDKGWLVATGALGAPSGLDFGAFPESLTLNYLMIRIIALFSKHWATVMNIFFLFMFPLASVTALMALRRLKLSAGVSIVISLLFAFQPYHFFRGQMHLHLSAYYMVPLIVLMSLWVHDGEIATHAIDAGGRKRFHGTSKKTIASVTISLLVAASGVYYAFFACFFLLVAGMTGAVKCRKPGPAISSIALIAILSCSLAVNLTPSFIYRIHNGENREALARSPEQSEIFGLKLSQLLLPISGHRVKLLEGYKDEYNSTAPLVNENNSAALGLAGSIGFLLLIAWLFMRKRTARDAGQSSMMDPLSELNMAGVLLGTIGGFGTLFAYCFSPMIRGYNRISIFIAFFSLLALGLMMEKLRGKIAAMPRWRHAIMPVMTLVLAAGLFDQTSEQFVPSYKQISLEYDNDRQFVAGIEKRMKSGSMVFQLPYVPFPENPAACKMTDYDHFRGYLHSNNLRWSYGAIKGGTGDAWLRSASGKPTAQMLGEISRAGFSGIYIDRHGYADNGTEIERELSALLGVVPYVSGNNRMAFYDMRRRNTGSGAARPAPGSDNATSFFARQ